VLAWFGCWFEVRILILFVYCVCLVGLSICIIMHFDLVFVLGIGSVEYSYVFILDCGWFFYVPGNLST
jgi:hypothetical protein